MTLAVGLALSAAVPLPAVGAAAPASPVPSAVSAAGVTGGSLGIAAGGTLQFDAPAKRDAYLAAARDLGATWLRFDFTWNDIQRSNASTYDWARYDALVASAKAHGLQVLGMIGYAPSWARDPACAGDGMCRPRDPAEYGTFAGQVARRYSAQGVHHWEIWNEPNTKLFFKPAADPAYYTRMLAAADAKIHAADPAAVVITGGTAPAPTGGGDYTPPDFVAKMYAAGARGAFDVLGHHPYCYAGTFNCPGTDAGWSAWSQMSATPTSLRSLMAANGDSGKKIWGTEFGAPTGGDGSAVSEAQQASMLSDGVRRFSGYSWSGPLFLYSLQDRGTNAGHKEDWFGVLRADGSRKRAFGALESMLATLPPKSVDPAPGGGTLPTVAPTPAPAPVPDPTVTPLPTLKPPTGGQTGGPIPAQPARPVSAAPVVTSVSPAVGAVGGGTVVTLTGTGLAGTTGVIIGGRPATGVRVVNQNTVTARTPAASGAGKVDAVVTSPRTTSVLPKAYEYRTTKSWWERLWSRMF